MTLGVCANMGLPRLNGPVRPVQPLRCEGLSWETAGFSISDPRGFAHDDCDNRSVRSGQNCTA